jgi:hypothetical protein
MDNATALIAQQGVIGLMLVFVQNWLKQQKWLPFIDYKTTKVNHLVALATTGAATLGIHAQWSAANHTLLITGLAWQTVLTAAYHWLQQFAITKGLYTGLQGQLNPPVAQMPTAVVPAPLKPNGCDSVTVTKADRYKIT